MPDGTVLRTTTWQSSEAAAARARAEARYKNKEAKPETTPVEITPSRDGILTFLNALTA